MKDSRAISFRVSNIIQKKSFVKDILNSIVNSSGRALLVGGAVRDVFLDIPTKDLDFEVYGLTLEQLQKILEVYGPVSLQGKSFGVLRVHGLDVDWSLPRKDSSGRHPVVTYDPFMSYEQAFIRRDLTINAMGIDMQTFELIDPFHGLQDLHAKVLRAPDVDFFAQDPLRLLRVMQFAGRFEMKIDEKLSELCSRMDISKVSRERIEQEFAKLFLQATRPAIGLQWLEQINKFHELLPGVHISALLWSKLNFAARLTFSCDQEKLSMMWSIIASCLASESCDKNIRHLQLQDMRHVTDLMRLITRHDLLIMQVAKLVSYACLLPATLSDAQIKWLACWLAPELSIRQLAQFVLIRYGSDLADKLAQRTAVLGVLEKQEEPLLTGKDFLDVAQGAQLGALVKLAYQLQIDQGLTDRFVLKALVLKIVE